MKVLSKAGGTLLLIVFCVRLTAAFDTTFTNADSFLQRYVCNGGVDYTAAAKDTSLGSILTEFARLPAASFKAYSRNLRLATLINLYNLATIKLIINEYPVSSIKDIDKAWSRKWIAFGGTTVSLNQIEHTMIRKQYNEPLIHFALVCAAKSCPALRDGAFTAAALDQQLRNAASAFLSDTEKNSISQQRMRISKIFLWYGGDFKPRYSGVEQFIRQTMHLDGTYAIDYLPYDWSLNKTDCSE